MPPHHLLTSLSVIGGAHFPSVDLAFLDSLNTLIGGRGTGKTSVLFLLRFALGAPVPAAYAKRFDDSVKNTLGPGRVTLGVTTQHGVSYSISRSYGEPPCVRNAKGEIVQVSLDGDLFGIEAYAPSEIERLADSASAQLALLDRFAAPEMRRIVAAIEATERRLAQNASELARLAAEIEGDEALEAELPSVAEALKGLTLEGSGDAGEAARAQERKVLRGRERRAMTELAKELATTRAALDAFAVDSLRRLGRAVEGDLERGACGQVFTLAHQVLHRTAGAIEVAAGKLRAEITSAEKIATAQVTALAALHHAEDEAYQALVVRQDADRERSAERERLHRRFDELSTLARRMDERRRDRDAKLAERRALLAERTAHLKERFAVRCRVAGEITLALDRSVEVTLVRGADHTAYVALLRELLHGANVRPLELVAEIANAIPPDELVAAALRNDTSAIEAIDSAKTGKPARAQKILAALRASGRLSELETAPLDDLPVLKLKTDKGYQASDSISTGQKCVCILSILLLQSACPLLIDQIEDNLDNAYVYDVLVKTLRTVKTGRQLLLVSHNPNIPVLGDSERVFVLETRDAHGALLAFGTVDETREHIERILEGGREAFLLRSQRYGHDPTPGERRKP